MRSFFAIYIAVYNHLIPTGFYCFFYFIPYFLLFSHTYGQATSCPAPLSSICGIKLAHSGLAIGQRVLKLHSNGLSTTHRLLILKDRCLLRPVFQRNSLNTFKMVCIVCNHNQIMSNGSYTNQQIKVIHWNP